MRVGRKKLNLEDGQSWLGDYMSKFIMSCCTVQPKADNKLFYFKIFHAVVQPASKE